MKSQQRALQKAFEDATQYSNPGIIGTKREEGVKKFLKDHLPRRFDVVRGEAVDFVGTQSLELDLMVYDASLNAPFTGEENIQLIPAEALLCIVEVKSALDGKEWQRIARNVARYLEMRPYRSSFAVRRGSQNAVPDDLPRCFYSVVAFSSRLANRPGWAHRELDLMTKAFGSPDCLGLDRVLILDRGVINPLEQTYRDSNDMGASLFTWYVSMANFLNREASRRDPMDWQQYAGAEFNVDWRAILPITRPGNIGSVKTPRGPLRP